MNFTQLGLRNRVGFGSGKWLRVNGLVIFLVNTKALEFQGFDNKFLRYDLTCCGCIWYYFLFTHFVI